MHRQFIVIFAMLTFAASAQVSGIVKDAETKVAIPYLNIWVEGANLGATADESGNFRIEGTTSGKKIVLSAVGYQQLSIDADDFPTTVFLKPQTVALDEVRVTNAKETTRKIGRLKNKKGPTLHYTDDNDFNKPGLVARYFKYDESYRETPFLNNIRFKAGSIYFENEKRRGSQIFNVRLYAVGKDGSPGEFLHDKNIIVEVRKGYHNLVVDVSKYRIDIPIDGFFVVVEWLLIDQNRHVQTYPLKDKTYTRHYFGPDLEVYYNGEFPDSWILKDGRWQRNPKILPAIEIELGN